ncbi:MAG: T9SS type A sorting domain-containing protein [Salibacteraceae bacterium]
MKPIATYIVVNLALVIQVSAFSQTIDYHLIDELPQVRTEKIEPDGSVWYSYVKQDTFHLDSISPFGQTFNNTIIPLLFDTQQFYTDYWLEPGKGLVVTIHHQHLIYESGNISVQLYDLNGSIQWERYYSAKSGDFTYSYFPRVFNDSLFLYGYSQDEGDTSWDIGLFNLSWNGDSTNFEWISSCGTSIARIDNESLYFMDRSGCSLNGYADGDTYIKRDTNFDIVSSHYFKSSDTIVNGGAIYGVGMLMMDTSTFYGSVIDEFSHNIYKCIIKVNQNQHTWYNAEAFLHGSIMDAKELNNGFLLLKHMGQLQNPDSLEYANIEVSWINKSFQHEISLWSGTALSAGWGSLFLLETAHEYHIYMNMYRFVANPNNPHFETENIKLTVPSWLTTSIANLQPSNTFSVFPNPANQKLNIHSTQKGTLEVYDLTGILVSKTLLQNPDTLLDISSYNIGIYILKFTENSGTFHTQKLLISR